MCVCVCVHVGVCVDEVSLGYIYIYMYIVKIDVVSHCAQGLVNIYKILNIQIKFSASRYLKFLKLYSA